MHRNEMTRYFRVTCTHAQRERKRETGKGTHTHTHTHTHCEDATEVQSFASPVCSHTHAHNSGAMIGTRGSEK